MDTIQKLVILGQGAAQEQELTANQTSRPACFTPQHITDPLISGDPCGVLSGHPSMPPHPTLPRAEPDARYTSHRNSLPSNSKNSRKFLPGGIHTSPLPGGSSIRLLKVLQTNICEFDCFYCEHRASRDVPRTYVSPEELARTFMMLHQKRLVEGLFLSSGITKKIDTMQERMVQTVEILRKKYEFKGYIHLKILPGASANAMEQSLMLADRVSINMEAPNPTRLKKLTYMKDFIGMLSQIKWIKDRKLDHPDLIRAGTITQFVVGGADESDQEILSTTERLYQDLDLRRAYFSAFSPIPDTPLENHLPTPLIREHRLYQADWLMRFYGFKMHELVLDEAGNLPLEQDPKQVWALAHPDFFPLEVNTAPYELLLRVPGIGLISAKRIVAVRRSCSVTDIKQLTRLGVAAKRAAAFLLLKGRLQATISPRKTRIGPAQLDLWTQKVAR
jgi:putative DNA modification/repair radical SAM protein